MSTRLRPRDAIRVTIEHHNPALAVIFTAGATMKIHKSVSSGVVMRLRNAVLAGAVPLLVFLSTPAFGLIAVYDWQNATGSNGIGSLTLNSALISDSGNFSNVPLSALASLSYTWTSGTSSKSITLANVTFWQLPYNFSAAGGFLTAQFNASDFPTNSFSLQGAAFPASSLNSLAAPFPDADAGYWHLKPIPEPETLVLFAAGLVVMFLRAIRGGERC